MNRASSEAALEASFARASSTPNTSSLPYEEFLEIEKDKLRLHLIDPINVFARPCQWAIDHSGFQDKAFSLVAIASDGHDWLLYEESSGLFYLAQKDNNENLLLIGLCSDDALAEWRG
jgi:hypothetical protein